VSGREPLPELPVFSARLDEIMGMMIKGQIPNVGRFCGYCYTPLGKDERACRHCGRSRAEYAPLAKIPAEFFVLYRNMRKRESLIVNSFAYLGLAIALALFVALVAVAVYRYNASWVLLLIATVVFMVGGRVFAGLLGGWIGDNVGYEYAQRKLAVEWVEYERARDGAAPLDTTTQTPSTVS
jgi:hypothetical protein